MEFDILAGLLAGFIGTIAMTAMMKGATTAGMTNMPGMPLILGSMTTDDPDKAKKIGMVLHVVVMGSVVFGTIYAAIFAAVAMSPWLTGLVVGLVHGLVFGVVAKMMGSTHPKMEGVSSFTGDATWTHDTTGIHIAEPGLFAKNYGGITPTGIVVAHALYGLVAGLVYGGIV